MSKPTKKRPAKISSLMTLIFRELMAINTSLNMEPEAIENVGEDDVFLAQTDVWAKHAGEHADAAWGLCDTLAKRLVQIVDPVALGGRPAHLPHFKKPKKIQFKAWLYQQRNREDRVGDLAKDAILDSKCPVRLEAWRAYLTLDKDACDSALDAFDQAKTEYEAYEMK